MNRGGNSGGVTMATTKAKWPSVRLEELAEFRNGVNYNKSSFGEGVKVVGVSDFQDYSKPRYAELEQINPEGIVTERNILRDGDIIFVRSNGNRELIGRSLFIEQPPEEITHSAFTIRLRFSSREVHPKFYAYCFRTPLIRQSLTAQGGGTNINNLNQDILNSLVVPVPPLPVQRRIAGILSAYDELMENSQRRIRILEAMARALYREWFVHFRFPGHEKLPRVASPLGDIPNGWEVKLVKDILSRCAAGTVYREADVKPEGAIPVLDQSTDEFLGFHDNEPDHSASAAKPMAIFGDHTCKMQLLIEPFSVGPNVVPFAASQELPTAYAFYAVNSLVQTQEYKRHWIPLNAKEIVVADCATAHRFASLIQPMLVAQEALRKAIRNLRRTRDLLLPRLLSGQVELRGQARSLLAK
ncbi:MAG: restriction endonuclease subunit S [Verrucomicrobiota bacterium]